MTQLIQCIARSARVAGLQQPEERERHHLNASTRQSVVRKGGGHVRKLPDSEPARMGRPERA